MKIEEENNCLQNLLSTFETKAQTELFYKFNNNPLIEPRWKQKELSILWLFMLAKLTDSDIKNFYTNGYIVKSIYDFLSTISKDCCEKNEKQRIIVLRNLQILLDMINSEI